LAAFALNVYWLLEGATFAALLPLLAIPPSIRVVSTLLNTQASREYNRLLALAAFVHMLFGVMLSVGFLIR
jgi:1,4-dihydroxy-2-naphthoate octaprenyltransferase